MADAGNPSTLSGRPDDRDATADARDRTSASHDTTADERDELAVLRDSRAEARDSLSGTVDLDAASDRNAARRDRSSASGDRTHASSDRLAAQTDRQLSSQERVATLIDELTGCYRREAGFHELEREIIKAERTEQPFTMAFIDIDGLKTVNDTHGHEVGDVLLRAVASSLRGVLRDYDIVVRYGGDEFVCGMSDVHADEVAGRLEQANTTLRDRDHATVSFGVVERLRGEGLASLISRADADMYEAKISRRGKSEER